MAQDGLFEDPAKYAIDTNVIISFLGTADSEHYPLDVFRPQWEFLEAAIKDGRVVAPRIIETELGKWQKRIGVMSGWLHDHRYMFRDLDSDAQLDAAKQIVNAYPAYGADTNYLGDLEVMAFARARGLKVMSLEHKAIQVSARRPKIPNVCEQFGIGWVNLAGFLRDEGFSDQA